MHQGRGKFPKDCKEAKIVCSIKEGRRQGTANQSASLLFPGRCGCEHLKHWVPGKNQTSQTRLLFFYTIASPPTGEKQWSTTQGMLPQGFQYLPNVVFPSDSKDWHEITAYEGAQFLLKIWHRLKAIPKIHCQWNIISHGTLQEYRLD